MPKFYTLGSYCYNNKGSSTLIGCLIGDDVTKLSSDRIFLKLGLKTLIFEQEAKKGLFRGGGEV